MNNRALLLQVRLHSFIGRLFTETRGANSVEYIALCVMIAGLVVAGFTGLGDKLKEGVGQIKFK